MKSMNEGRSIMWLISALVKCTDKSKPAVAIKIKTNEIKFLLVESISN